MSTRSLRHLRGALATVALATVSLAAFGFAASADARVTTPEINRQRPAAA